MVKVLIGPSVNGLMVTVRALKYLVILGVKEAFKLLERGVEENEWNYFSIYDTPRNDPRLLAVYYFLGKDFSERKVDLVIIPDGIDWDIGTGDSGAEWVYEKHRHWFDVDGKTEEDYG